MPEDVLDLPAEWDFTIFRSRQVREFFGFSEDIDDNGDPVNPINLDLYTITAELRKSAEIASLLLAEFTVAIASPATGELFLELTAAVTADLPLGIYYYDIKVTDKATLEPFTWAYGTVDIKGSVTDA